MPEKTSDSRLPSNTSPSKARLSEVVTDRDMPVASRPASLRLPPTPSSSRRNAAVTLSSPVRLPSSPASCASSRPKSDIVRLPW